MPNIIKRQNLQSWLVALIMTLMMTERANHGFRVKGDVPCQLAHHAGLDALDGQ